ncbi:MAG TPA: hypothetical protein VGJ15_09120, partial [Pirellulales bacterium]
PFWLIALVVVLAALVAGVAGLFWACQQPPDFYAPALAGDSTQAQRGSDALLREAAALASNVRRIGHWQALFTAEQINGWLAYDVLQNHPRLLPAKVRDLRVAIDKQRSQIAFRWQSAVWSGIVAIETEIYLRQTNVVAVRICQAHLGLLPLPLRGVIQELVQSGRDLGLQIDEQQIEGDPLLIVTLPWAAEGDDKQPFLESLEISNGEIYVAGRCDRPGAGLAPVVQNPGVQKSGAAHEPADQAQAEKLKVQR